MIDIAPISGKNRSAFVAGSLGVEKNERVQLTTEVILEWCAKSRLKTVGLEVKSKNS